MHELKHKEITMRYRPTGLAVASLLFASAPYALADTTIIHAGELLADIKQLAELARGMG
jgi:hypothetical protein